MTEDQREPDPENYRGYDTQWGVGDYLFSAAGQHHAPMDMSGMVEGTMEFGGVYPDLPLIRNGDKIAFRDPDGVEKRYIVESGGVDPGVTPIPHPRSYDNLVCRPEIDHA